MREKSLFIGLPKRSGLAVGRRMEVWQHLAGEEYLLSQVARSGPALFLWQSRRAVVIGKNQNPWRECDVGLLRAEGGVLARRVSGGGAVYHDAGNLNYSFVVPRADYHPDKQFHIVLAALKDVGISAEVGSNHGLFVDKKKVSGNAFCLRGSAAMHHGTLLVHSDLARLNRYLQSPWKVEGRSVASKPAGVANLREFVPGLTLHDIASALERAFVRRHGSNVFRSGADFFKVPEMAALQEKMVSWEWCYGMTPPFDLVLRLPAASAPVLRVRVEDGIIRDIQAEDSPPAWLGRARQALHGCRLEHGEVGRALEQWPEVRTYFHGL